ncbi:unnamed protein product [Adineta ricciae]|uniref:Integrase catalytic domain-containing protein n=1 Tax=Adineta ricciae TaxID=249248 RepID=A0A815QJJ6_ADIRI|nr:unnamed protein product [Adineta ricciae]CAF1462935.1 unnamed protein product [Adineta ricciae]
MASSISSPGRITTASSVITSSETLVPTTPGDNIKLKNDFVSKISAMRNELLNNPVFTIERYNETMEIINNAKLKNNSKRNDKEISLLKAYDVINLGNQDKLIKKIHEEEDTTVKYYVPLNEIYDVIRIAHSNVGHRGIKYTSKEIKKRCANVTEKQVKLFISNCEECKIKRSKPRNSSKLVINPILSNDFSSRAEVDLIDMQSSPDGPFKFILNYQDHFTKFCVLRPLKTKTAAAEVAYHLLDIFALFGAPLILQSDNGREFTALVIEELSLTWKNLKIVHGKPRHPQSQGSVERCNQDTKQLLGTWIRENNSTKCPYSVLFGNEPKLGLSSTSLHPSVFNKITTEEELINKLDALTADEINKNSCASDNEEEALNIVLNMTRDSDSEFSDDLYDNDQLNATTQKRKNYETLTNRFKTTTDIRQSAREGQKRQANEFLQNTAKRQKLADLDVGDNVLVPLPDIDRGPTDARNVLAVIMEIKNDKFKLGAEHGLINGYYSFNQISKAPGTPTLLIDNINEGTQKSLREIAKSQSITGGQAF